MLPNISLLSISSLMLSSSSSGNISLTFDLLKTSGLALSSAAIENRILNDSLQDVYGIEDVVAYTVSWLLS